MGKQASIMVKSEVADKIRFLSDKSGISMAKIVEELSILADFIPQTCEKVTLAILPRKDARFIQFVVLPIYSGSFEVSDSTSEEDVDRKVREQLKKKVT